MISDDEDELTVTSLCDDVTSSYRGSSDGDTMTSTDFLSEASKPRRRSKAGRKLNKREFPEDESVVSKIDEMMRTVQDCYKALDVSDI